jgi:hypothetical protein
VNILALTDLSTWPLQVLSHLEKHYARFLGWESKINMPSAAAYDVTVFELIAVVAGGSIETAG